MSTEDKVQKFLNNIPVFLNNKTNLETRKDILQNFNEVELEGKISLWNEYFGIENKDRVKFWEKLLEIDEKNRGKFLKSAGRLSHNEKIDLYNKTPEKFREYLTREMIVTLPAKPAKKSLISIIAIYLIVFMVVNLVFLLPTVTADIPPKENLTINNMTNQIALVPSNHTVNYTFGLLEGTSWDIDTHFIFLVFLGGSLGALIHGLAKISQNTQDGIVKQRDTLWYVSRPFLGAALAISVYLVFRGGFLTTTEISVLNPYGISALSVITGLSTKQVTQKLKDLLDAVFPSKPSKNESTETK